MYVLCALLVNQKFYLAHQIISQLYNAYTYIFDMVSPFFFAINFSLKLRRIEITQHCPGKKL